MGVGSTLYDVLLLGHLLAVIVGFGPLFLNPAYGAQARKRRGPAGLAVAEANFEVSKRFAEKAVYAVPVFGIALVAASDGAWKFTQLWVVVSIVLYAVAIGLSHGVLQPAFRRLLVVMPALGAAGPASAEADEAERLGKQIATAGMAMHVLAVVIIALMIWKPGV